jgi:hypothetical protein
MSSDPVPYANAIEVALWSLDGTLKNSKDGQSTVAFERKIRKKPPVGPDGCVAFGFE